MAGQLRRVLALIGIVVIGSIAIALVGGAERRGSPRAEHVTSARATGPKPTGNGGPGVGGGSAAASAARAVHVHCSDGDDRQPGTLSLPLRTVAAAAALPLRPGDSVLFARGCTWQGPVVFRGSGKAAAPLVLAAYGTGADPVLRGAASEAEQSALQLAGDYLVVRNLRVTRAAGTGIAVTGKHVTISDVEVDHVGIGVLVRGAAARVNRVRAHDLHMIVNTPGGDDDYGATGFNVQAADATIGWSSCIRCRAPSLDYGHDGGFVEIWNHGDRLLVHDSTGEETDGILEIGGDATAASARGVTIRDNTFRKAHGGVVVHTGNRFAITVSDLAVSGNTITNTMDTDPPVLSGDVRSLRFEGNTVSTPAMVSASGAPLRHRCNRYTVDAVSDVGFQLDGTERTGSASPAAGCGRPSQSP